MHIWKFYIFDATVIAAHSISLIICFFVFIKASKIVDLEQNLKSACETIKGLEQKTEQDKVNLSE